MAKLKPIKWAGMFFAGLGALNWGLVSLFSFNLVEKLTGTGGFSKVIYALVGISGVWALWLLFTKKVKC